MKGPALIPAAGRSVRMGRPKLLLPLGEHTVLERLISAIRGGGVERLLVVVRPDDAELAANARAAGASVLTLPTATPDMRATVQAGLAWLEEHLPPAEREGFFLLPADHPTLAAEVFRGLLQIAAEHPDRSIFLPTHAGRRGHPTLIRWCHADAMRRVPEGQGMNTYLRSQAAVTCEIPWPDEAVLTDLDTPQDYERLRTQWEVVKGEGQ